MKSISSYVEDMKSEWLANASSISELLDIKEDALKNINDEKSLGRHIYLLYHAVYSQGADQFDLFSTNHKRLFDMMKNPVFAVGLNHLYNEYVAENKINLPEMHFTCSYKDQKFFDYNFSVSHISQYPDLLDRFMDYFKKTMMCYLANEEACLLHMDGSDKAELRNYYQGLFDLPLENLKIKLLIWKDNYPGAYKRLIEKFDIPSYEEVCEREESLKTK